MTKRLKKVQKISFHAIAIVLLSVSVLLSVVRFQPVFWRVAQAFEDVIRSVGFYFSEIVGFGNVRTTVNEIPAGMRSYLPIEWSEFKAQATLFGNLLFSEENLRLYFSAVGRRVGVAAQWILLLMLPVCLVGLVVYLSYGAKNNNYNVDTKPLRIYKKIEDRVLFPIWHYVKRAVRFVRESKYFPFLVLVWLYNLSLITIFIEGVAYVFYFSIAIDFRSLYTQIVKFGMDMTIPIGFLPWWVWLCVGWKVFTAIRYKIGVMKLNFYEACNRAFLEVYVGALFVVGKQRAKKTTIITDMALTEEVVFREKARELIATCDKQFPFFPWVNVELFYKEARARHALPTLASHREFFRQLRLHFERDRKGKYDFKFRKGVLRHLKKRYGYQYNDFIFGYDYKRYGVKYDNHLTVTDVFEAIENYAQLFYIYAAPTSLIFGNYSIRTDIVYDDEGNFPNVGVNFFESEAREIDEVSQYCHILDFNSRRLGKVTDENDPYKDGLEIGITNVMEFAKERGNQHTNAGMSVHDAECNVKNDGYELDTKMKGHDATIMYYTFKRDFIDDQRPDSLSAENKDLCDIVMIKDVSEEKIVLPCFSWCRLLHGIATRVYDKIYYWFRHRRGDNTLFVYLMKRLYSPFHNYYDKRKSQFTVQTATLKVWDAMGDEVLNDKGKYYISHKKVYSNRFATDGIKDFYHAKALRSKVGLNDYETFGGVRMTRAEMQKMHSRFYDQIDKIFRKEQTAETPKKQAKTTKRKS